MKTSLVLCFLVLLCTSTLANASHKHKLLTVEHLTQSLMELRTNGYTVDRVVQLLNAILNVQQGDLATLIDNWNIAAQNFLQSIGDMQAIADTKKTECTQLSTRATFDDQQIERYNSYIDSATASLHQNIKSLQEKEANRCANNIIFIERLADNEDAISLLEYLHEKIQDPTFKNYLSNSNQALLEMQSLKKTSPMSVIGFLSKHHIKSLLQQNESDDLGYNADVRSDVGTGHIDNVKDGLHIANWEGADPNTNIDTFIYQLTKLIEDLITALEDENEALRTNEFKSVRDFIVYDKQLKRENLVLQKFISQWSNQVTIFESNRDDVIIALGECNAREDDLLAAVRVKQDEYEVQRSRYVERRQSLEDTILAIQKVIELYTNKVLNRASETEKQRIDDHLHPHSKPSPPPVENPSISNPKSAGPAAAPVSSSSSETYVSTSETSETVIPNEWTYESTETVEEEEETTETTVTEIPAPIPQPPVVSSSSSSVEEEEEEEITESNVTEIPAPVPKPPVVLSSSSSVEEEEEEETTETTNTEVPAPIPQPPVVSSSTSSVEEEEEEEITESNVAEVHAPVPKPPVVSSSSSSVEEEEEEETTETNVAEVPAPVPKPTVVSSSSSSVEEEEEITESAVTEVPAPINPPVVSNSSSVEEEEEEHQTVSGTETKPLVPETAPVSTSSSSVEEEEEESTSVTVVQTTPVPTPVSSSSSSVEEEEEESNGTGIAQQTTTVTPSKSASTEESTSSVEEEEEQSQSVAPEGIAQTIPTSHPPTGPAPLPLSEPEEEEEEEEEATEALAQTIITPYVSPNQPALPEEATDSEDDYVLSVGTEDGTDANGNHVRFIYLYVTDIVIHKSIVKMPILDPHGEAELLQDDDELVSQNVFENGKNFQRIVIVKKNSNGDIVSQRIIRKINKEALSASERSKIESSIDLLISNTLRNGGTAEIGSQVITKKGYTFTRIVILVRDSDSNLVARKFPRDENGNYLVLHSDEEARLETDQTAGVTSFKVVIMKVNAAGEVVSQKVANKVDADVVQPIIDQLVATDDVSITIPEFAIKKGFLVRVLRDPTGGFLDDPQLLDQDGNAIAIADGARSKVDVVTDHGVPHVRISIWEADEDGNFSQGRRLITIVGAHGQVETDLADEEYVTVDSNSNNIQLAGKDTTGNQVFAVDITDDLGQTITLHDNQDFYVVETRKGNSFIIRLIIVTFSSSGNVQTANIVRRVWGYGLQSEKELVTADDFGFELEDGEQVAVLEDGKKRTVTVVSLDSTGAVVYTRAVVDELGNELTLAENEKIQVEVQNLKDKVVRRLLIIAVDETGNTSSRYVKVTIGDKVLVPEATKEVVEQTSTAQVNSGYSGIVGDQSQITTKSIAIQIKSEYISRNGVQAKVISIAKVKVTDGKVLSKIFVTNSDNTLLTLADDEDVDVEESVVNLKVVRYIYVVKKDSLGNNISKKLVYTLVGEDAPEELGAGFNLNDGEWVAIQEEDHPDGQTSRMIIVVALDDDKNLKYIRDVSDDSNSYIYLEENQRVTIQINADEENNLVYRLFLLTVDSDDNVVKRQFLHVNIGEPIITDNTNALIDDAGVSEDDFNHSLASMLGNSVNSDSKFAEAVLSKRRF